MYFITCQFNTRVYLRLDFTYNTALCSVVEIKTVPSKVQYKLECTLYNLLSRLKYSYQKCTLKLQVNPLLNFRSKQNRFRGKQNLPEKYQLTWYKDKPPANPGSSNKQNTWQRTQRLTTPNKIMNIYPKYIYKTNQLTAAPKEYCPKTRLQYLLLHPVGASEFTRSVHYQ